MGKTKKMKIQSAWRTILVANEFYELTLERRIDLGLLFIFYIIFLEFFGLRKKASEYNITEEETNKVL